MLKKDPMGGYVGTYQFGEDRITYHVEGTGPPVLITMGISGSGGSYTWRYIFDCLAGAFQVYSMDVLNIDNKKSGLKYGPGHYSKLIADFLTDVVKEKASIIAGPVETPFVMRAASEVPALVHKILLVQPDGVRRVVENDTIARNIIHLIMRIPKIESIRFGTVASKRSMMLFLRELRPRGRLNGIGHLQYPPLPRLSERRFMRPAMERSLMEAPARLINQPHRGNQFHGEMEDFRIMRSARLIIFQRSGELPRKKEALRFCDDTIKFLG